MNHVRYWLMLAVLSLILASGIPVLTQESDEIPQVLVEAIAEGFTISETIPEGVVAIIFQNNAEEPIYASFMSLNEGATPEEFAEAFNAGPQEFLLLASIKGSILAEPGTSAEAILDFAPGEHVLLDEDNIEMRGTTPFTVADEEGDGAAEPQADVTVGLTDFGFNVPPAIPAGPQLWHVQNLSQETPHELLIARLDDDMPAGAVNEILLGHRGMEGVTEVPTIVLGMSEGEQFWVTYDLEPGTYALVCFLPDIFGSGMPHALLGMHQIILVVEAE